MKIRRFTEEGLERFAAYVSESWRSEPPPREMLADLALTESFLDADIEPKAFDSKYELGREILTSIDANDVAKLLNDQAVWPWLSLLYSESTMPIRKGEYFIGDAQRHLLGGKTSWKRYDHYHRHLVRGAVQAVSQFGHMARVILGRPDQHTKFEEQLMSRKVGASFAYSKALMEVVNRLYWDGAKLKPKRGAKSTGAGSIVRLIQVLQQIDVTFDVASLDADRIYELLPESEFKASV